MQATFSKHFFIRLILMVSPVFLLTGCGPESAERHSAVRETRSAIAEPLPLKGQVFVVTSNGKSVTLGSVPVQLFEAETMASHIEEKEREIESQQAAKVAQIRQLEDKAERELARKEEAERGHSERVKEMRAEVAELTRELDQKKEALAKQISTNQEAIVFFSNFPPPPKGIPSQMENEAYEELRAKWISMSAGERKAWSAVLIGISEELKEEEQRLLKAREEAFSAFESELRELSDKIAGAEEEWKKALKAIADAKAALEEPVDRSIYLEDLPKPLAETRTDAAGEFAFEVDDARGYVVVAQVERKVEGELFDLSWLVSVDAGERARLLLSNHNVIGSDR